MTTSSPPKDILEVLRGIDLEEALGPNDPRWVDTRQARGSQETLKHLARTLGLLVERNLFVAPMKRHILFFGHVGAGKTTELKHYGAELERTGFLLPVEIDVPKVLDRNNLQYADLLMAMADALLDTVQSRGIYLPPDALRPLESWFADKVEKHEEIKDFVTEVKAGAEGSVGLPLLVKLFGSFSQAFRVNATYKEELRRVIRNTFTQLADAFNALLRDVEQVLGRGRADGPRVFFIVDGTDKLGEADRRRLFVEDVELLLAIEGLAIYTAPIALKYEIGLHGQLPDLVLPMIKLEDADKARCEAGWRAMRDILLKRADRSLFASDAEVDRLAEMSGGHPRELLRLLREACLDADDTIDAAVVGKAVARLASDYRRLLQPEDYPRLAQFDQDPRDEGNDEQTRRLLYRLALLEYNDGGWRRSHPVIRTLPGYQRAMTALG